MYPIPLHTKSEEMGGKYDCTIQTLWAYFALFFCSWKSHSPNRNQGHYTFSLSKRFLKDFLQGLQAKPSLCIGRKWRKTPSNIRAFLLSTLFIFSEANYSKDVSYTGYPWPETGSCLGREWNTCTWRAGRDTCRTVSFLPRVGYI